MSIKEKINKCVKILDICKESDIQVKPYSTGKFTHRCKCPSKDHKSGSERTDSLYINAPNNNFYCFGCGEGSKAIDFYMICNDKSFSEALSDLRERVSEVNYVASSVSSVDNFEILIEISDIMRNYLYNDKIDKHQYIKLAKFVDSQINKIDQYDVATSIKLLNFVKNKLNKRGA